MLSQSTTHDPQHKDSNLFLQFGFVKNSKSYKVLQDGQSKFGAHSLNRLAGGLGFTQLVVVLLVALGSVMKCNEAKILPVKSDNVIDLYHGKNCEPGIDCNLNRMPIHLTHMTTANERYGTNLIPTEIQPDIERIKDEPFPEDNGYTLKLRKVRIEQPESDEDIHIYPVRVTIPVKVDEKLSMLPPIKQMYRMHEYTTQETKLEKQMVPVTETVIKPVGLSRDQIVTR